MLDGAIVSTDSTYESTESIRYVSLPEHYQFMSELENDLLSICSQDPVLKETLPLISCCTNDSQYNDHVSQYLQSKVDHHHGRAFQLKIHFFNGETCDVYMSLTGTILELKRSIERSIGLQLQSNTKERKQKVYRQINWKHVWRKYDLWVDRKQRIRMCQDPPKDTEPDNLVHLTGNLADTIIANHSTVEFTPRRSN